MTRYYALVLVTDGTSNKGEACKAAFDLLHPYMRTDREPIAGFKFDYMLDLEEIAALSNDKISHNVWKVAEIVERFAELEVEAILTPDGRWH